MENIISEVSAAIADWPRFANETAVDPGVPGRDSGRPPNGREAILDSPAMSFAGITTSPTSGSETAARHASGRAEAFSPWSARSRAAGPSCDCSRGPSPGSSDG